MKAIYTEAARHELEAFQGRQQRMLEGLVAERKLVLGDEVLEITASDIKAASERIQVLGPTLRRAQSTELVTRAYIVIGVSMMVGAIFYPQLMEIYASNRTQALIFFTGATMAAAGWLFSYWVQTRRRRMDEEIEAFMKTVARRDREVLNAVAKHEGETNPLLRADS
jgi:hypothetical protein